MEMDYRSKRDLWRHLCVTYIQMWHSGHRMVTVCTVSVMGFGHAPVMVTFGNFVKKV